MALQEHEINIEIKTKTDWPFIVHHTFMPYHVGTYWPFSKNMQNGGRITVYFWLVPAELIFFLRQTAVIVTDLWISTELDDTAR